VRILQVQVVEAKDLPARDVNGTYLRFKRTLGGKCIVNFFLKFMWVCRLPRSKRSLLHIILDKQGKLVSNQSRKRNSESQME
jgi:hypothetical protein